MVSEKSLKDSKGRVIGYEITGTVIKTDDYSAIVEIRPKRNQSAIIKIEDFEGDYRDRLHSKWTIGDEVRIIIIKSKNHILVPQ
ncbi:hypothetical protein KKA72_02190 [Patescibacteria group bacterium]|nr:hypothetical protein [Patescibacteria group bacterium]MBU1877132.1 hypothetical protein [Patescibacteria group bacterium]